MLKTAVYICAGCKGLGRPVQLAERPQSSPEARTPLYLQTGMVPSHQLLGEGKRLRKRRHGTAVCPQLGPHHLMEVYSSGIGLVLLAGTPPKPIYANSEALQILTYPQDPARITTLDCYIAGKVQTLLSGLDRGNQACSVARYLSGSRNYLCRAFSLNSDGRKSALDQPAVVLLLERDGTGKNNFRWAEQYRLTMREQETLQFLMMGLTNKGIADRVHVSPNTIKAFLRTIMVKTGASTRSGIVGKGSSPLIGTN